MEQEKKTGRGGVRAGSGRKPLTQEQREAKAAEKRQIMLDELLFPALVTAMKANPGMFKDRYLEVELSKDHIFLAYGKEGLEEWMSYFTLKKIGGIDRNGQGYLTRWSMNLNKYSMFVKMLESVGHNPKDLPEIWFPPEAMMQRVTEVLNRRDAKRKKKLEVVWDEMEQGGRDANSEV